MSVSVTAPTAPGAVLPLPMQALPVTAQSPVVAAEGAPQAQPPPMPPLPPPVPRPSPQTRPNVQCQAACMQAASTLNAHACAMHAYAPSMPAAMPATMPAAPPLPPPHPPDLPPISHLLLREAEAWRALLQLNASVLNVGRSVISSVADIDSTYTGEHQDASDQREAAYVASLSQLLSCCDSLVYEAVKLRGLRKAKQQSEVVALREVIRKHSDEVLATGEALARNSALQIASLAADLRNSSQKTKAQIQQARGLLSALAEAKSLEPIPPDATIVMGYQSGGDTVVRPVGEVLRHVYQRGDLTDSTLCSALWEGEATSTAAAPGRVFARRSGDRGAQVELASQVKSVALDDGTGEADVNTS